MGSHYSVYNYMKMTEISATKLFLAKQFQN